MSDPTPRQQTSATSTSVPTESAPKTGPDLLMESELFWEKYKTPLIAVVLLAVLGLVGSEYYRHSQNRKLAEASAQLNAAKGVEDYKKVIAAHDDTLSAANAYLLLGRSQADAKDYTAAVESWKTFVDKFPQHPLVPNALMGQAGALEAQGKFDEARKVYQRVETDFAKSYLAPLASLAEAAMLKAQGKIDDAKRVYENVIAGSPQSDAARQATESLRLLKAIPNLPADPKPTPAASLPAAPGAPALAVPTPDASATPTAPVLIPAPQTSPAETAPVATPATTPSATPAMSATPVVPPPATPAIVPTPAAASPSPTPAPTVAPATETTPAPTIAPLVPAAVASPAVSPMSTPPAATAAVEATPPSITPAPASTPVVTATPEATILAPSPTP